MCGRYYVNDDMAVEMERIVQQIDKRILEEHFGKDIHPTDFAPIIIGSSAGLMLTSQRFGYPGVQDKGLIFNARAESVLQKKMFYHGIRSNRAVIPVTCFYEWNKNKEKVTFSHKDAKVLYLAGFYDRFGEENRFVILTTAANASVIQTHDRMPVILEEDQIEDWIRNDSRTEDILRQIPVLLNKRADYEQQTLF